MNFRFKYKKEKCKASKKNIGKYVLALEAGNNLFRQDTEINNHKRQVNKQKNLLIIRFYQN